VKQTRAARLFAAGDTLRLIATAAIVPAVWLVDAPTSTHVLVTIALFTNLCVAVSAERYSDRHPTFPVAAVIVPLGLATAFAFSFLSDSVRIIGIFGYFVMIGFVAGAHTRKTAAIVVVVATGLAIVRELFVDPDDRWPALVFIMFFACGAMLATYIDALKDEASSSADAVARVYEAMRSVTSQPGLAATLESLTRVATDSVGGSTTGIMLFEDRDLVLSALAGPVTWPRETFRRTSYTEMFGEGHESPMSIATSTRAPVVVEDIGHETRFPAWREKFQPLFDKFGVRGMISLPLRVGDQIVGVMETVFVEPVPPDAPIVALLELYAEQAALVIVRAQAYERERLLAERLAEADSMKSDFLALVSHELRTPLTAAKGFVDTVLLQWDRLEEEPRRELLSRASRNAAELVGLIDQLLEYSRIESSEFALDITSVSVSRLLDNVVDRLAPVLEGRRINIDVPREVTVNADARAVGHIVANLLTNAAKFAPARTAVHVHAELDEGRVLLAVSDMGPGIPLGEQEAIFDRFYQSPEHRVGRRGTGLGLAIARRYAEALGGRLWVESEPGAGATFVCALPAGLTPKAAAATLDRPV
jgi:signal transduction histidine kinase